MRLLWTVDDDGEFVAVEYPPPRVIPGLSFEKEW